MRSKLNSAELWFYFSVWITANFYSLYKLFQVQSELLEANHEEKWSDLEPGWEFISRYRDVSDLEWSSWKHFFHTSWYYLMFQFFISEMIRVCNKSYLKYWYILSTVIFITTFMGLKQMVLVAVQPIVYLMIIFSGAGKSAIWVVSILLLMSYNTMKYKNYFWQLFEAENLYDEDVYLILVCIAWIELRCISFCIEYIDRKAKLKTSKTEAAINNTSIWETIINMLSYTVYLPLLCTGPVVLYEDFERSFQVKSDDITKRLRRFIWDMALFLMYTFILDLAFHYIYFYAMQNEIEAITELPTMALCGGGLWMGLEFHMKYVISYGTTAAFARLDNLEPPPTPRCIARVHVYSQMWRYFDVGLYKFLVKYIYKPGLGVISRLSRYLNLPLMAQKLTASLATFIFIFIWHGTVWEIFVWSALNFLGITLEHIGQATATTEPYRWFKKNVLRSDEMEVRFLAVVCTPLLSMSAISNFYLFGGSNVGNVFFACFLRPSSWYAVIVALSLYSCCHVSIALQNVPSRTDVKKQDVNCKAA